TCSATLRASDQRIAEVSKLPDTACAPSDEIASARTGPPWPRNCACAPLTASGSSKAAAHRRRMRDLMTGSLTLARLHAEGADALARLLVAQGGQKCLHRGPLAAVGDDQKVVVFRR